MIIILYKKINISLHYIHFVSTWSLWLVMSSPPMSVPDSSFCLWNLLLSVCLQILWLDPVMEFWCKLNVYQYYTCSMVLFEKMWERTQVAKINLFCLTLEVPLSACTAALKPYKYTTENDVLFMMVYANYQYCYIFLFKCSYSLLHIINYF